MKHPAQVDERERIQRAAAQRMTSRGYTYRARQRPAEMLQSVACLVQLGKAAGARVIGVVGGQRKAEAARALGADVVIDRHEQDFVEVVKDVTGGRGADVVYDPVGGEAYARSTKCIAFEGRILIIGFASGQIPTATLNHALIKNYSIVGLHWGLYGPRSRRPSGSATGSSAQLVADGAIRPLVGERLSLDDVPGALDKLAHGDTVGRIVFTP